MGGHKRTPKRDLGKLGGHETWDMGYSIYNTDLYGLGKDGWDHGGMTGYFIIIYFLIFLKVVRKVNIEMWKYCKCSHHARSGRWTVVRL